MEELLQTHAGELRRVVLRRPVELTGGERTWRRDRKSVVHDPLRHFAVADYCIAKGSIDHLVGAAKERERH
jgi:hypothetical protein